jgi:ferredoxin-NADP reductase
LLLRGPKGSFTMDLASDAPRWFVAGGTGLAPILSMLRQMARSGDQRRSRLFFGVNIENELFALSAIDELKRALPRLRTTICVWMPGSEWRGFVGTPADAVALALTDEDSRPDIYVCGPPALIEATKSVSVWAGIGRDRVFSEQFSPS